jgi:integrase
MAVRKSGDRWIVEFMQRGVRIFRRLPAGRTKADAQQLESKLRGQIFNAVDLGKLPDPLLSKVIDEWLETRRDSKAAKQTKSHVNRVKAGLDRHCLSDIATPELYRVVVHGLAPGTANRRLCVLKAVAKYAYQKGYIAENLSPKIQLLPEKKYQRREVDMGAIQALMDAATTPRARALIAFSAYTGMRLGEVLKLTPKDAVGGFLRLRDTKSGEDREVPIPPELEPHLKQLPFKGGWRNVYRGWLSARKRAGLTLRYHDLRHMAVTAMVNAGKSPLVIADLVGHKSLQTTRKYSHPSREAKRDALGAITAGLHQGAKKKARK